MNDKEKYDDGSPDYGSSLVWSNDDQRSIRLLLDKYEGNLDEALKRLFQSGGTDYASARQLSVRLSAPLGLTEAEFMQKYRRWKKGKPLSG